MRVVALAVLLLSSSAFAQQGTADPGKANTVVQPLNNTVTSGSPPASSNSGTANQVTNGNSPPAPQAGSHIPLPQNGPQMPLNNGGSGAPVGK
jgi:hypothetical protein